MTDNWFLQDIEHQLKRRKRVVLLDPKGLCGFLLPLLESKDYIVIQTDSSFTEQWQTVKEELLLRHKAETIHKDDAVVFYVTREQSKLTFLFDYCFTHGCLDLSNPIEWLRKKLFTNTNLQIQMDSPMLLIAAKLGIGKDIAWWKRLLQKLQELISIDDELLPFLHEPVKYLNSKDSDIRRLFEEKLFELLGQPYMSKTPKVLADEVVKRLFDGLAFNDISSSLLQLYYKWADSETYRPSLEDYIKKYKLDESANPWSAHPDHCLNELDHKALRQITGNLRDKSYISDKLSKIKVRVTGQKVKRFVPSWWQDVITLIEFDSRPLTACNSLEKVIGFYTEQFSKVDRAIRNLYAVFLQEETIIRPLQEYYENLNHELLQRWFTYADEYKSGQQGYLVNLLKKAESGIAVIVADGLRYEIASFIASELKKEMIVNQYIMMADIPSDTENNMSALYAGNSEKYPIQKAREKKLTELTGKNITYMNLEALNYGVKEIYLVLTYKDIDTTGEKLQHGAIKLFEEFEQVLKEKILLLINIGYKEVHLVTDHGFVLTGLLDESDKIEPNATGKIEVHERFIRTAERQNNSEWISFEKPYGEYKYVYVAKNHRPFKSRGVYGFSHGGFTPQEIIIPNFVFKKEKAATAGLKIVIINKKDLGEITGELFGIKLLADTNTSDLFAYSRKVQIMLYGKAGNYSSSDIVEIDTGQSISREFSFSGNDEVKAVLVDANTHEQLDMAIIKKSNLRDIGL